MHAFSELCISIHNFSASFCVGKIVIRNIHIGAQVTHNNMVQHCLSCIYQVQWFKEIK